MYVFRIGAGLSVTQYDAELMNSPQFAMLTQEAQRRFQADVIPESLLLAYPQLSFSFYRDRFTNFRNLSGFQLTEQVQEGLSGASSIQFADRRLGSSSDVISLSGNFTIVGAGYPMAFLNSPRAAVVDIVLKRQNGQISAFFIERVLPHQQRVLVDL